MASMVFKYYNDLPMIPAIFGKHAAYSLYDTGADGIFIPQVLAQKIIRDGDGKMLPDQVSVLTGNGYITAKKMRINAIKIPGLADFDMVDAWISPSLDQSAAISIIGRNTLFSGYHVIIYDKGKRLKITDEQLT